MVAVRIHQHVIECPSVCLPLRDHRIHMRNALNVNARGTTKRSSTRAEVDSNSSSTMPTAYRTKETSQLNAAPCKGEVQPPKMK